MGEGIGEQERFVARVHSFETDWQEYIAALRSGDQQLIAERREGLERNHGLRLRTQASMDRDDSDPFIEVRSA
jgi:hypothetical protein